MNLPILLLLSSVIIQGWYYWVTVPGWDICVKHIFYSNLAKSRLPIIYFTFAQLFWNFAQSMAVTLPCSVQNFKIIDQTKWMLWTNESQMDILYGTTPQISVDCQWLWLADPGPQRQGLAVYPNNELLCGQYCITQTYTTAQDLHGIWDMFYVNILLSSSNEYHFRIFNQQHCF